MSDQEKLSAAAAEVRDLASAGQLAHRYHCGSDDERRRLRSGAIELAAPLLFQRVTRPLERRRGHFRCATGVQQLAADCLDRFHLDLDAMLDDLFSRANLPIDNLEGWLTMRMHRAIVDAYRRRRGARGAPQRPRVPNWLKAELGHDAWLVELARAILEWAGIDATAGSSLWPLNPWVERRAALTGDHGSDEATVDRDVQMVLAAMQKRATWYQNNVERPLGHKPPPVWYPAHAGSEPPIQPEPLDLNPRHQRDEALLQQLAATAIEVMIGRIDRGEDPAEVVPDVLGVVFGAVPDSADGLDRTPNAGPDSEPEQVGILITDPAVLDRIIATVLDLIKNRNG